jgi:gas vesicle protein
MSYAGPAPRIRPSQEPVNTAILAAGVLAGIAVGAGVALLLAPQSGEETREGLARRGRRWARRGRDAWDDLSWELRRARNRRRRERARARERANEAP